MKNFKDKIVVITGAASGIGKALAQAFADRGAKLVLSDRNIDALKKVTEEISSQGREAIGQQADVSNPANMEKLAQISYQRFGQVHILCNNAGVIPPSEIIADLDIGAWDQVVDVNIKGVIYGMHFFLNKMLNSGEECHILNTASIGAVVRGSRLAPYYASKSAVMAISECAALECEDSKVHISVLCPGAVNTPLANSVDAGQCDEEAASAHAAFREVLAAGVTPDETAAAALAGIENEMLYIFTHPEYKEQVQERFERILAAYP